MSTSNVTVTSPTGTYLIDDQVTPNETMNVTGTSNGTTGDSVDINCYRGLSNGITTKTLAASVPVNADGTFAFSGSFRPIRDETCVLRAVPHGDTTAYLPGAPSSFTGPTLAIGERSESRVSGGPNNGALKWYYMYVSQLKGAFDYDSLGDCSISDSYIYDPTTFGSVYLDYCNAWFWWENGRTASTGYATPTRSELQVDGADAFLSGNIPNIASFGSTNSGFPAMTYSYSIDPASGNLALDETDQVVKCSPGGAYPPTSTSCSSFVPAGIQVKMHIVQGQDGRVASVIHYFSSTDGQAHQVDLLEDNEFFHVNKDGQLNFPWTGSGMQAYTTVGQTFAGPGSGPGSFFIKGSASVPDGGETAAQGSATFSNAPDNVTIIGATTNTWSWVDLGYKRTVPATGALALGFTYGNAFTASEVAGDAAAAEAAFRPGVSITQAGQGTLTAPGHVTVLGTAGDANGTPSVTVNGLPAALNSAGIWSVQVPVNPGANTITAVATNVFGNTSQASTTYTYTPPPAPPAPLPVLPVITKLTFSGKLVPSPTGVTFKLKCTAAAGSTCKGSAQLSTLEKLLGSKITGLSAKAKRRNKRVTVGSTSFTLKAGQTKSITVKLNATGRKLLARFKRLPVTLKVTLTSTKPPKVLTAKTTIKPKKKKKK